MKRTHNYKVRMRAKNGGLFTVTRNAVSPQQAMRYADTEHEALGTGAVATRAWKHAEEPDPRDWHEPVKLTEEQKKRDIEAAAKLQEVLDKMYED